MSTFEHLIGHKFPGGIVAVPHWQNWLYCDAVLATHPAHLSAQAARALGYPAPIVHPGLAYYAGVRGARTSFGEIFDLFEFDQADGPMIAEQRMLFTEPVFEEIHYEASGGITSVARKQGRRAGVFDLVTFETRLSRDGILILKSEATFVLPRRQVVTS